ncbi:hypothetical protein HQ585_10110 [candidate division KSB1 bacterium]|nr:hypothetical protein [candidate division KSB1 bacterium]
MRNSLFVLLFLVGCAQSSFADNQPDNRTFNDEYTGAFLNRVAFPIGGIGAGMFCLEGTGAISHLSLRNKPDVHNEPTCFSAFSIKGRPNGAKVLEGPVPGWKIFGKPESGNGSGSGTYGLPRFEHVSFLARFPFCTVELKDKDIPCDIKITGWSPFIPGDADNSSLPVGALEYHFKNTSASAIEAVYSFNSTNFMKIPIPSEWGGTYESGDEILPIQNGFILAQKESEEHPHYQGDCAVFVDHNDAVVDHCWFRGGWFDPMTMTWMNIENGDLKDTPPQKGSVPGASIIVPLNLEPGEEKTVRLHFAWFVPHSDLKHGSEPPNVKECDPATGCCDSSYYIPWYAGQFKDVKEVSKYWKMHYSELQQKSRLFTDTFYDTSLPDEVVEAVAANLTILKSPTVLRQKDGKLWCWEGCHDASGCCYGSCTHVWNYAQAIPHLFPSLERSLRETEFLVSQDSKGHQTFRTNLPISTPAHDFHAATDGQLGGMMKMYRDWRISGDTEWLEKLWPNVKSSMDFCIETWDPKHKGVLEEPHHNTYDIEFWGPDGMCTSFYLGALNAIVKMGEALNEDVDHYVQLYEKGRKIMENELFDGEYFIQRIVWQGLEASDPVKAAEGQWNVNYSDEAKAILQKEGPKYQYGKGCLSDGILGSWISSVCGLDDVVDPDKVKSHLKSVYTYNLKHDLTDHVNPQRPSFAVGNEGGLLLCTWPKGGKLSLPFVYSNEVWTGIEYQVASHLMMHGLVEEGLDIVRTCRKRYDGRIRNPFNEYECGHWYARAMASYGLIQGLTGIRYDAISKSLYIDSKIGDTFKSFLSTETGFGTVGLKKGKPFVDVKYGDIDIDVVYVSGEIETFE